MELRFYARIKGRLLVNATFDGIPYRGQVVKMGTPCYIIGVTKQIRKQIGKSLGDMVEVVLHCLVVLRKRKPCMRSNIMKQIEEIIRNATEEEQEKVDWTKAWSTWISSCFYHHI